MSMNWCRVFLFILLLGVAGCKDDHSAQVEKLRREAAWYRKEAASNLRMAESREAMAAQLEELDGRSVKHTK
jgi:hypothetical protein